MKRYEYWLASMEAYGIGLGTRRRLKARFGSAKGVYNATVKEIEAVNAIKPEQKDALLKYRCNEESLVRKYEELKKKGIRLIAEYEIDYPKRLQDIKNRPDVLFVKGKLPDENLPAVSIVGSRHATPYGKKVTEYFTAELSKVGIQIISGMAYGIDSFAHETAMKENTTTFAVMGCGIDICYPAEKIAMYNEIQKSGGIISEFPPGIPPLAYRFPMRNRIIAGLADIIVVVEAREKSGSLITANHALEQGKDVYVVPGRIDDLNSIGCNQLWFDGAIPALSVETILEGAVLKKLSENTLYIEETQSHKSTEKFTNEKNLGLASNNDIVYSCLDLHPKSVDELVKLSGKSPEEVILALVEMQFSGKAEEIRRGFYIRKNIK